MRHVERKRREKLSGARGQERKRMLKEMVSPKGGSQEMISSKLVGK